MKSIKNFINLINNKYSKKQALFVGLAFILFVLLIWLVVSNFIFIVDQLNQAFASQPPANVEITTFDIEGFQELNLIQ